MNIVYNLSLFLFKIDQSAFRNGPPGITFILPSGETGEGAISGLPSPSFRRIDECRSFAACSNRVENSGCFACAVSSNSDIYILISKDSGRSWEAVQHSKIGNEVRYGSIAYPDFKTFFVSGSQRPEGNSFAEMFIDRTVLQIQEEINYF